MHVGAATQDATVAGRCVSPKLLASRVPRVSAARSVPTLAHRQSNAEHDSAHQGNQGTQASPSGRVSSHVATSRCGLYVGTVAYTFTTHTTPHSNARHRAYSQYSDDRYIHTHTEKVKKWPTRHARTPLELLARAVRVAAAPSLTPGTSSHSSSRSWSTSRARCTCRQPKPACTRTRASPRRGTHCRSRTNSTGTR